MISYRDMTFCPYHEDCMQGKVCPRALTEDVHRGATAWWGNENAPISIFAEVPHCMEPKKYSVYEEETNDDLES